MQLKTLSAVVAGALLTIAGAAQAGGDRFGSGSRAGDTQLICDRPLSSSTASSCVLSSAPSERIWVMNGAGEPVRSGSSSEAVITEVQPREGVLITQPGSDVYILEPVSGSARGERVIISHSEPSVVERSAVDERVKGYDSDSEPPSPSNPFSNAVPR